MFTWEEAGLLRQLLLIVMWSVIGLAAAAAIWIVARL
jgi:hypothetical protein